MLARVKPPARARAAAGLQKARTTVKARVSAGPTASPWRTRNNRDFSGCQEDRWLIAGPPSFNVDKAPRTFLCPPIALTDLQNTASVSACALLTTIIF